MCLGKAYLEGDGKRELILEEVALIEIRDRGLHLSTLFGEEKDIAASIKEIDFENSRVILERTN